MASCSIEAVQESAASILADAGVESPRREAGLILSAALGRPRAFLIAHPEFEIPDEVAAEYFVFVQRRASREPYHYITGTKEFFGLEFRVGPGVLIPRPETEILVDEAIRILSQVGSGKFLEVGVGSGCISISILNTLKGCRALGVDISAAALAVATLNADELGVSGRLELRQTDLYDGIGGRFDLIVSNPPYIPDADLPELQPEVRLFEPHIALFAGKDGLAVIRKLIDGAAALLEPSGILIFEIGIGQAAAVLELLRNDVWSTAEALPDLQGIPRVVRASLSA